MSAHFNKLTPAEAERLAMLAEEAGEIVQAVGKILRHGYESCHPQGDESNRNALAREIGDLLALFVKMKFAGDVDDDVVTEALRKKFERLPRYSHHQEDAH